MTTETNEPPATTVLLWAIGIIAIGYFAYTKLFPSDRAQVRSCISVIMEASRADVGYGEYRSQLLDLDAADVVVITDEIRQPFGNETILTLNYSVDGTRNSIMCAR